MKHALCSLRHAGLLLANQIRNVTLDKLHSQLYDFFQTDEFEIKPSASGASTRQYYEINFEKKLYFPSKKILLMQVPPEELKTLIDYVHIDFYLTRMGIPTPRIYEMKKQFGWIFLEYQNKPTVLEHLVNKSDEISGILEKLIDFLILMQERCRHDDQCPAFQRSFDREKYLHEFEDVKERLLSSYYNFQLSKLELGDFREFAKDISVMLDTEDKVFAHGDFQSSNIFYDDKNDISFKIIDFQDARYGAPVYDLASCLWDSYIPISDDNREGLHEIFFEHLKKQGTSYSKKDFQTLVDYAVIQRKLHDATVFAYDFKRNGDKTPTPFISASVQMAVDKMKKYNHFKKVMKIFEQAGDKSA